MLNSADVDYLICKVSSTVSKHSIDHLKKSTKKGSLSYYKISLEVLLIDLRISHIANAKKLIH